MVTAVVSTNKFHNSPGPWPLVRKLKVHKKFMLHSFIISAAEISTNAGFADRRPRSARVGVGWNGY